MDIKNPKDKDYIFQIGTAIYYMMEIIKQDSKNLRTGLDLATKYIAGKTTLSREDVLEFCNRILDWTAPRIIIGTEAQEVKDGQ